MLLPILVLVAGAIGAMILINSRKEPPRSEGIDPTPVVTVVTVQAETVRPSLEVYGEVTPNRQAVIQAQVSGVTVSISERLTIGGLFNEGEELLRIEPIDYELAVDQRSSELARAKTEYEQEQGRQVVARREWEFLGEKQPVDEVSKRLALRQPQLQQAETTVRAAQSALKRAKLDLERTVIRAPFNTAIVSESAEVGQLVTAGSQICRIVCTDDFHIVAAIPLRLARDIETVEDHRQGAKVSIYINGGAVRTGRVLRVLPDLENDSRMVRFVVEVKDPLALEAENQGLEKLFIESYLRMEIEAPDVENAIRLPRAFARAEDTVWVFKDGKLEIRDLEIRFRETDHLVVTGGLEDGDQVVISSLPVVTQGMAVRLEETP